MPRWIESWNADDDEFWQREGRHVARRNLVFSIFAEFLGFSVWLLWSVTAAQLNKAGFDFSTSQLFTLVSVPALVGATLRIPYTLAVSRFGGRNWTVVSALLLLIPVGLLVVLVSNPATPYWAFLAGAATAGLGGGNFASSMANISYFYPKKRQGFALGLNAAGGNLGVAVAQLVVPIVVTMGSIALIGGPSGGSGGGSGDGSGGGLYLQNAGLVWLPFILASAACAWLFMDNLRVARARLSQQVAVARRGHTWVMSWLYTGTFGSFIGYSAGLPLLMSRQFPSVKIALAFLGPLVGSLSRPVGGWLADRLGGARVTFAAFGGMVVAVLGVVFFLDNRAEPWAFAGFLSMFVVLFVLTGVGNGSTYRMIPAIFTDQHLSAVDGDDTRAREQALLDARRETAAALGFIGAIGAYGGWLIPQAYGLSTSATGGPQAALLGFVAFYGSCLGITWWFYLRSRFAVRRVPSLAAAGV